MAGFAVLRALGSYRSLRGCAGLYRVLQVSRAVQVSMKLCRLLRCWACFYRVVLCRLVRGCAA